MQTYYAGLCLNQWSCQVATGVFEIWSRQTLTASSIHNAATSLHLSLNPVQHI